MPYNSPFINGEKPQKEFCLDDKTHLAELGLNPNSKEEKADKYVHYPHCDWAIIEWKGSAIPKAIRQIEVVSNLSSPFSYSGILTNLPDGVHNLAIQTECEGWDLEIHGLWARKLMYENSSDLITFTVYEPEPFPVTVVVAATAISATVVGVGLMVYFKNRKR